MRARQFLITFLAVAAFTPAEAADHLLLHWDFDGSDAAVSRDLSGNMLHGAATADRVDSPNGSAVLMDGTPKTLVTVMIPEGKRFGKDPWTFMAMVKPARLTIDSPQNQRRIFSFGTYPDAYLVIDLVSTGRLSWYFCYRDATGRTIASGGSSDEGLVKDAWAHVALVCDREKRRVSAYINGFPSGGSEIADRFDGNFSLGGKLSVGSAWQNYCGLIDEVKIHRRVVSPVEVEGEFERLKKPFRVVESEAVLAAKNRARMEEAFSEANAAWAAGRFGEVRRLCRQVMAAPAAPAQFQSYAHLRLAQSHLAEGDRAAAMQEYELIATMATYPSVHRDEARVSVGELDRVRRGLPALDPSGSRTVLPEVREFAAEVFVSPAGDDANRGSESLPFASLERARDEVRTLKNRGVTGPIAVTLMPGEYPRHATFALEPEDSGTDRAPVVYRAKEAGTVVFYGGRRLPGFRPVSDPAILERLPAESRGKVGECALKDLGVESLGELKVRGFAQPSPPPTLEVYVDRVPMTLARWPNEGFVGIGKLIRPGARATGEPSVFEYLSDRHARWTEATDAWLFGYFHFLWADATIKVGKIDPKTRTLTTAEPYHYSGRGMSTVQGIQYHAFNLLEEIDVPGEWYLERQSGMLYLYPPSESRESTVEIGMLSAPMVRMDGVSHVRLEGLGFDLARDNGILVENSRNCALVACTISRMAGNGVMIHGGRQNSLIGCDIHTIGRRASEVIGGDRVTLTPGRHLVENCRIHDFGRIDRTYTPAIQLEGVGNRVAHNLMYKGPSSAMRIEGNDHLIEFNEVHSMVRESDDQGALELFRNPTYRGVVFRHNYLHHIGKTGTEAAVHGQAAIRFDDAISGMLVYGNVFHRCANGKFGAVQMNSGRDNLMDNNLFIDCKQGISGGWYPGNNVWKLLREGQNPAGFFRDERYLGRYPKIATMLDEPGINHLWRNVFYRCGKVATRPSNIDAFQNAVFDGQDPGFENVKGRDFGLRDDALLFKTVGFKPIPFRQIGLYESPARASWPVETTPVELPDWRRTGR